MNNDAEDRMRKALRHVVDVLGPNVPACCCDGCNYEMGEALKTAKEALGDSDGEPPIGWIREQ